MKLIFDVRNVQEPQKQLQPYLDSLSLLAFHDELWISLKQRITVFKDFDKYYKGILIKVVDEAN